MPDKQHPEPMLFFPDNHAANFSFIFNKKRIPLLEKPVFQCYLMKMPA
jgi:hypothetical protein